MIPIPLPNWYIAPYNSKYPQATGFNRGYLFFGDNASGYSAINRVLSFATYTETTYTNFSTVARIQPMTCASPTHVYQFKGYTSSLGYTSVVNKVSAFTSTESVPTISFSAERRGGMIVMPHFQRSRMYYVAGYSDSTGIYTATTSYVTQNTETETAASNAVSTGRHMGGTMMTNVVAQLVGGYTAGGGTTNANDQYTFATDTRATSTGDTYNTQNPTCFSSNVSGYRFSGVGMGATTNTKYSFAGNTWSATTNTPDANGQIFGSGPVVNQSEGIIFGGYQNYAKRNVYRLTWSTEVFTNSSYTTGDANAGFIYYHGTY
jgi:hypothetical protein